MADQRILYTEYMVGATHPSLADTLNRLVVVEHAQDGLHQAAAARIVPGHLFGLALANGDGAGGGDQTNDITIAAGEEVSNDAAIADRANMVLASALTKRLDAAWAVGSGNGGLDTGSIADTTYHLWLIQRPDTGVVDALFSTSATTPSMPTNYTKKRRIGSILREAGSIVAFIQDGDLFQRSLSVTDVNAANPGAAAVTRTLSVPIGINVEAVVSLAILDVNNPTSSRFALLTDLATADVAPDANTAQAAVGPNTNTGYDVSQVRVRTNAAAQIRSRMNATDGNTYIRIQTFAWYDRRGRDA